MSEPLLNLNVRISAADHPSDPFPEGWNPSGAPATRLRVGRLVRRRPVDVASQAGMAREVGLRSTHRWISIRIADLTSIEIEQTASAHTKGVSKAGLVAFGVAGGLWNSGRQMPGETGILVQTKQGWILFADRASPLATKAQWSKLMKAIENVGTS